MARPVLFSQPRIAAQGGRSIQRFGGKRHRPAASAVPSGMGVSHLIRRQKRGCPALAMPRVSCRMACHSRPVGPTTGCRNRGLPCTDFPPPHRASVTLVRHDVNATRSASNRGSLRSCRPRSPLCRKDRANHQSNSQSTRRYPSRSSPPNVGTPLRVCHGRVRPSWANGPGERPPPCSCKEC